MSGPVLLTADVMRTICTAVAAGDTITDACLMGGVSIEAKRKWLKRGAEERRKRVKVVPVMGKYTIQGPDGPEEHEGVIDWTSGRYRAFLDAYERAQATFRSLCVGQIRVAGADEWKALAWLLEKRFPGRFGKRERHEVTGAGGGPVETVTHEVFDVRIADILTPEQLAALEARLAPRRLP